MAYRRPPPARSDPRPAATQHRPCESCRNAGIRSPSARSSCAPGSTRAPSAALDREPGEQRHSVSAVKARSAAKDNSASRQGADVIISTLTKRSDAAARGSASRPPIHIYAARDPHLRSTRSRPGARPLANPAARSSQITRDRPAIFDAVTADVLHNGVEQAGEGGAGRVAGPFMYALGVVVPAVANGSFGRGSVLARWGRRMQSPRIGGALMRSSRDESSVERSIRKEALVSLARNPVSTIRATWNRRGGGPEARLEKAKRTAESEAYRKQRDRRYDSQKDGRDVQSDRPF
jgi:hypothetical protein